MWVYSCVCFLYSTRGLGKALAREFLLSGDRVVIASRRLYGKSWYLLFMDLKISIFMICILTTPRPWLDPGEASHESVDTTVKELEENLREGLMTANDSSRTNLAHAKVVGISCDVCEPSNVQKLANFAVNEFGSIDIWVRDSTFPVEVSNLHFRNCFSNPCCTHSNPGLKASSKGLKYWL